MACIIWTLFLFICRPLVICIVTFSIIFNYLILWTIFSHNCFHHYKFYKIGILWWLIMTFKYIYSIYFCFKLWWSANNFFQWDPSIIVGCGFKLLMLTLVLLLTLYIRNIFLMVFIILIIIGVTLRYILSNLKDKILRY